MSLSARVVARRSRKSTASTYTWSFLVESLTTGGASATPPCGASGKERKRTVPFSSRKGRHPLTSQLKFYYLVFNQNKTV